MDLAEKREQEIIEGLSKLLGKDACICAPIKLLIRNLDTHISPSEVNNVSSPEFVDEEIECLSALIPIGFVHAFPADEPPRSTEWEEVEELNENPKQPFLFFKKVNKVGLEKD